ncbi:MAG: helix-turn-helix transcriptional regulator [Opitutaceae bacterium]|nr:helix-turn-helix transcriptional regulator [Opitutaceae bacterium]
MLSLKTESDVLREVADSVRAQRVALNWRQEDLATRSGVSIATLRRFERTGQIGFLGLAKLLVTLGLADQLLAGLKHREAAPRSMEAFLAPTQTRRPRQRVRTPSHS